VVKHVGTLSSTIAPTLTLQVTTIVQLKFAYKILNGKFRGLTLL
jgi:hypothetical protein